MQDLNKPNANLCEIKLKKWYFWNTDLTLINKLVPIEIERIMLLFINGI